MSDPDLAALVRPILVAVREQGPEAVEGLARLATAPLGRRSEYPDLGLVISDATRFDRAFAIGVLVILAAHPEFGGPECAERARALLATPALGESRATVTFGTELHGDVAPPREPRA